MPKKIVYFSILLLFFAASVCGVSNAEGLPALFHPAGNSGANQAYSLPSPDMMTVSIDFSLIDPEENPVAAMTAAMPDRTVVLLLDKIETRGVNNYSWFGKVEGHELSTVVLSVVDGIMYGNVNIKGEVYAIEPQNGNYLITKRDPNGVVSSPDDTVLPPSVPALGMSSAVPLSEDGSRIDLMVLYTPEMQSTYGAGLGAKIQSFVDTANQAYALSGINTQLALVGAVLYNDAGAIEGNSMNNALTVITGDSQVAAYRDAYYADMVSLLRVYHYNEGDGCGLAWVMTTVGPSFGVLAFSVVKVGSEYVAPYTYYCLDTTLVHELGHNMGCRHDRINSSSQGAYPYSYGYGGVSADDLNLLPTDHPCYGSILNPCGFRTDLEFGTIMSYLRPSISYFSNPSISYSGGPIGIYGGTSGNDNPTSSADSARTINNTRVTVANFRVGDTTPPAAPIGLSASPDEYTNSNSFSINWTDPSDPSGIAGAYYKIGASPVSDTDGTFTASKPFNVSATAQGGQTIYVWLKDGLGNVSRSNRATTTLYYDGTAPSDGTLTASQVGIQALLDWSGFTDSGGSGLRSANTYKVVRNAGTYPPVGCISGTQVYLGTGTSTTDSSVENGVTYYYRACAYDNAGNVSVGASANFIIKYQLTTDVAAPGEGVISPACPTGCLYDSGTEVALTAMPESGHVLGSWSGDCSGTDLITSVAINDDVTCTASFSSCVGQPAQTAWSGETYDTIGGVTGAYANAHDPVDTIRLIATTLNESPDLDRDISITLSGGWDCGFSPNTSYSIIHGSLTVSSGEVTVERLIIY